MNRYVCLLRGINVGGKNLIKMPDLAACFQTAGYINVRTYIQSGNVIFDSVEENQNHLTDHIEDLLFRTFHTNLSVVLRSQKEMKEIVTLAPGKFGDEPDLYRYDVIFPKQPLTAGEVMQMVSINPEVDQAYVGNGVLYFSRLILKASKSRLTRIIGLPIYQSLTIRNWNTTTKLFNLMKTLNT